MLSITTTFEHIGHWIKMRQSLARFSGPESSPQIRSLADFIVTTSEFKFSVHTDIKADRLKLSPVDQHDLRDLIGMGLVEMRNDAPMLTNAGVNAIL
jgi:hypothetical protein